MGKVQVIYERESSFPDWATPKVLKAMHDDGRSLRELATQFKVSHQTIANMLKKASKTGQAAKPET